MKSILVSGLAVLVLAGVAVAKDPLPNAPSAVMAESEYIESSVSTSVAAPASKLAETKIVNTTFVSLALISTGSTFADSYTTLFARENWRERKAFATWKFSRPICTVPTPPSVARTPWPRPKAPLPYLPPTTCASTTTGSGVCPWLPIRS